MNLFRKRYSVCAQCRVHFEPEPSYLRHAELCPAHRKPVIELEDRIERVMVWAKANWEKLEPDVLAEYTKNKAAIQEALQRAYAGINQAQSPFYSGLSELGNISNQYTRR